VNLSKSRYLRGIQCQKILWLDRNKSEVRDDSELDQAILETGNKVGDLAMGYYGAYTEVPYSEDKSVMIAETQRLLMGGESNARHPHVICEASFSYDGNFCSVDILRVRKSGVEIIEVKSATSVKDIYYDDTAFQYYVLASSGLNVKKVSVMYINNEYERQGELDIKSLFAVYNCTKEARSMQADVAANIAMFKASAEAEIEPDMEIGDQCSNPYPCSYCSYCWQHIPQNSVFNITGNGIRSAKKMELYSRGIVSFEQLLESGEYLNKIARLQVESYVNNSPPHIDKDEISLFLETLSYPLYFLDFETFQEAIPSFDGQRPYMQIPFQYSLHIQETPGGLLSHREFLAEEGADPRRELAERLCADIPVDVCVLAYNMSFEKRHIREQAERFDDLSDHLMKVHDNVRDLMLPFQKRSYYSREMGGSYSIKQVLPALFPDEAELDYDALDLIHDGGEAMAAYADLPGKPPEERRHIRAALLAYCRLDTLAMVRILEKLQAL
jgi:hypothetical protein